MSYTLEWLEDDSKLSIVVVELQALDKTLIPNQIISIYLSNNGYYIGAVGPCLPLITSEVSIPEYLSPDDSGAITYMTIDIDNSTGELDKYLTNNYIFTNKTVNMFYGDIRWNTATKSEFTQKFNRIFTGVIENLDSSGNRVSLKVRDKIYNLANTPVIENTIGTYGSWFGSQSNQDRLRPVVLGEIFNNTPILIDQVNLEYMFSCSTPGQITGIAGNGASEAVLQIRDNGFVIWPPESAPPPDPFITEITSEYTNADKSLPLSVILNTTYTPPL